MGGHASSAPRLVSQCVKLSVGGEADRGGAEWQGRGRLGRPGGWREALAAEARGWEGGVPTRVSRPEEGTGQPGQRRQRGRRS